MAQGRRRRNTGILRIQLDAGAQRVVTKCVIMNCNYVNCCRSEHLFPSAVSVASDDLVSTDENYN